MKVRIYTNIESRVNENWNQYGKLISSPSKESFKDPLSARFLAKNWDRYCY